MKRHRKPTADGIKEYATRMKAEMYYRVLLRWERYERVEGFLPARWYGYLPGGQEAVALVYIEEEKSE